jgi:hypothetical protein
MSGSLITYAGYRLNVCVERRLGPRVLAGEQNKSPVSEMRYRTRSEDLERCATSS